jgi:hypothetical protein
MAFKVQLVKQGRIIVELPLQSEGWEEGILRSELEDLESTFDKIVEMHDIFSNKVRSRMLSELIKMSDLRFSELMNILDANQKIVNENKKPGEVHYTPSDLGFAGMLTCMMMRRILDEFEV